MQTSSISGKAIGVTAAIKEVVLDSKKFGMRGVFRGQGIGIAKAIVSLSMFHEVRHSACHRLPWAAVCLLSLSLPPSAFCLPHHHPPAPPPRASSVGPPSPSAVCLLCLVDGLLNNTSPITRAWVCRDGSGYRGSLGIGMSGLATSLSEARYRSSRDGTHLGLGHSRSSVSVAMDSFRLQPSASEE